MGRLNRDQGQLFYSFCLDEVVPYDHCAREIAAVLDLSWVHAELGPHYSHLGRDRSGAHDPDAHRWLRVRRPLGAPAVRGSRAAPRLCWFCKLDLEDEVPHHSTLSANRLGRFRDSDILRHIPASSRLCDGRRAMSALVSGADASAAIGKSSARRSFSVFPLTP